MKTKTTIDIDLDIFKTIVQHSNYINEPANDVLKRLLKLNDGAAILKQSNTTAPLGGLMVKGVFLKNGLQLRKYFKGNLLEAIVRDGYIDFNNKKYTSPSGAAVKAVNGSVNGWGFWDFLDEKDGKWKLLQTLRDK
jgi:hypothetical protein